MDFQHWSQKCDYIDFKYDVVIICKCLCSVCLFEALEMQA